MGFIFKLHEPGFFFPVNLNGDLDGTGVDFLRFIQVRNHAPLFEKLRADAGHVHQADGLVPVAIDLLACVIIGLQRLFDGGSDLRLLNFDFFQPR